MPTDAPATGRRGKTLSVSSPELADENLRLLLASITDYAIFALDRSGAVTIWNTGAEALFGYSASEAIGRPGDFIFTPEDRAAGVPQHEVQTAQAHGVSDDTRWHVRKDGSRFFATGIVRPLRTERGELRGFAKICRDTTARRHMEQALEQQANLLELSHDAVFAWELHEGIRFWNRAAEQLYGYSRTEAQSANPNELLKTAAAPARSAIWEELLKRGLWTGELRRITRDGRQINVDTRQVLVPQEDGQLVILETNRDITERTAAEEALRESRARLELAVAIAEMGTFEIDLKTDAVEVNEPGRAIYGWKDTRLTFREVQTHFHPDDKETAMRRVAQAFDPAGPGGFELEQRIIRTDGAERWIRVRGHAFFEGTGEERRAVRCLGTYLDITAHKEAETALRAADQRKDEFLAMLAHELRSPINAISSAAALLRHASHDPEDVELSRGVIERQSQQLTRLVDDLLDLSRIARGKVELRKAQVDLRDAISRAAEAVQLGVEEKNHRLEIALPQQPVLVEADLSRLEQVFVNLLNNAAKYSEEGGPIMVSVDEDGSEAVVCVADTGIGLAPEMLPRIFDLFEQGPPSVGTRTGLGIGLALVRKLVDLHHGNVRAESEGLGKGSKFFVTLPLCRAGTLS